MAIDPVSQLLFYVDTGQRHIGALKGADPTSHTIILDHGIERPKSIAVDYVSRSILYCIIILYCDFRNIIHVCTLYINNVMLKWSRNETMYFK